MNFIEEMKAKARSNIKNIVLPEGCDIRTLQAAEIALKEGYAKLTILGNVEEIQKMAKETAPAHYPKP